VHRRPLYRLDFSVQVEFDALGGQRLVQRIAQIVVEAAQNLAAGRSR
jgi:hypothetical protein